ncbi:lactose-specific PTS transporter subunit IIA [uncultured Helcococcus sp.]|uniref:lactose-specific PTS transporter subunit IIA n=1 Tax=uncultured Helcococcus sp. TaxID=1072508 RepID=UPI00288A4912|nr:lactose-specific PTS transporter subunit IIA [uncultured Helcococcus sp.]
MDRKEMAMLGFEIVAYAGDARSKLMDALKSAQAGDFDKAEDLIDQANEYILKAHKAQTDLLVKEASNDDLEFSITLVHGQDHLMTTVLLKDLMQHLLEMYRRTEK